MLTYTRTAVTRNHSEKSINNILDLASSSSDVEFMEQFYATTLTSLQDVGNDRLWLKTNLKLAKLWLDLKEYLRFTRVSGAHGVDSSQLPDTTIYLCRARQIGPWRPEQGYHAARGLCVRDPDVYGDEKPDAT